MEVIDYVNNDEEKFFQLTRDAKEEWIVAHWKKHGISEKTLNLFLRGLASDASMATLMGKIMIDDKTKEVT